jgi:c-di-GMP-binding flagellar brake protein YcgR
VTECGARGAQSFIAVTIFGAQHVSDMPDISTRLSTTGRLLVRSGIEIERLLSSMADDRAAVTAHLPSKLMFLSRVVSVHADAQQVMMAYSDHKPANAEVLAANTVTFKCNHRGAQFAFACSKPRHGAHSGQPAIRMNAPPILLAAQPRQFPARPQLPKEADVRCDLRMGLQQFGAKLIDVGLDGRAFILGDPAIPVCDGSRLKGARLRPSEREALMVDLEVDKVIQAVLPDGRRATRIGCRIMAAREELEKIIRLFIVDLQ